MPYQGRKLEVQIDTGGGSYTKIAALITKSLTINNETVDVTESESAPWRALLGNTGLRNVVISASGVFVDDATQNFIEDSNIADDAVGLKMVFENGVIFDATWLIPSFEYEGVYNDALKCSMTFESGGYVTVTTPSAIPTYYTEQEYLLPQSLVTNWDMGWSVAMSADGSTLAVGMPGENSTLADGGAVEVYILSGDNYVYQQTLYPNSIANAERLGERVRISDTGDTISVSAPVAHGGGNQYGCVRIYQRSAGVWSHQQSIFGTQNFGQFGKYHDLSGDGTRLVIGKSEYNGGNGEAAVYLLSGGTWSLEQTFTRTSVTYESFGRGIAINYDGSVVAVASPWYAGGGSLQGAITVFTRSGTTWSQQAFFQEDTPVNSTRLGQESVEINNDGTEIFAGQYNYPTGSQPYKGAVVVFEGSGASWAQTDKLNIDDLLGSANGNTYFGSNISLSADGIYMVICATTRPCGYTGNEAALGTTLAYSKINGVWVRQDFELMPTYWNQGCQAGDAAISNSGTRVALGAKFSDFVSPGNDSFAVIGSVSHKILSNQPSGNATVDLSSGYNFVERRPYYNAGGDNAQNNFYANLYDNVKDRWLIFSADQAWFSYDRKEWLPMPSPNVLSTATTILSIDINPTSGVILAGCSKAKTYFRSTDGGQSWEERTFTADSSILWGAYQVKYGNDVWVISSLRGIYVSSDDGLTWSADKTDGATSVSNGFATDGAGHWVAVGTIGYWYISSDNGANWTRYLPTPILSWYCVSYYGGLWVYGAQNSRIFTNTDGSSSITERDNTGGVPVDDVEYIVGIGWMATFADGRVRYSVDGTSAWAYIFDSTSVLRRTSTAPQEFPIAASPDHTCALIGADQSVNGCLWSLEPRGPKIASATSSTSSGNIALSNTRGLKFSSDGTKVYIPQIISASVSYIYYATLSTAWDVTSIGSFSSIDVSAQAGGNISNMEMSSDGTKLYVCCNSTATGVFAYDLSTAWDISDSSRTYNGESFTPASTDFAGGYRPNAVRFKSDGTAMFILSGWDVNIVRYELSTAWDVSTAAYDYTKNNVMININSKEGSIYDMLLSSDGMWLYILGVSNNSIHQFSLTSAWNIFTAGYSNEILDFSGVGQPRGMCFGQTESKLLILRWSVSEIFEYTIPA